MKAIRLHQFGGPEQFVLDEISGLTPGEKEIVIDVHAAGLNPVDAKIREGRFPRFEPKLPAVIGRDICGVIAKVGRRVTGWFEGEAVFGMLDYERGAYAQQTIATEREVVRKPSTVDPVHAARGVAGGRVDGVARPLRARQINGRATRLDPRGIRWRGASRGAICSGSRY